MMSLGLLCICAIFLTGSAITVWSSAVDSWR